MIRDLPNKAVRCHLCGHQTLKIIKAFEQLGRVTSDCVPWPKGGKLAVCTECQTIQRVVDEAWLSEIERIYNSYSIYHQSGGVEQAVFDAASGAASVRSSRLLKRLREEVNLPETGRVLDIGCGNGATLSELSHCLRDWSLVGTEVNAKYRDAVESIRGVERLFTCPPVEVPGRFDLVTMVHVLERIPSPGSVLSELIAKIQPGGLLVIQVPDCRVNPFDLLIADHATHFTPETLRSVVTGSGFEVLSIASTWVPKEITLVARPNDGVGEAAGDQFDSLSHAVRCVEWIIDVIDAAKRYASLGLFGIFGTSIASMALLGEMGDRVAFFVDEDPNRVGKRLMGRPVYHPSQVPEDSHVFLALIPKIALALSDRLRNETARFHMPPPFEESITCTA